MIGCVAAMAVRTARYISWVSQVSGDGIGREYGYGRIQIVGFFFPHVACLLRNCILSFNAQLVCGIQFLETNQVRSLKYRFLGLFDRGHDP